MKTLRYVCAQPAIPYYTWQVEVMINNFIKHGVNPNYIDIVCGIKDGNIPEQWTTLANTYNYVRFFFYEDDRVNSPYIPSIRPNILKKHFKAHPYLKDEAIFYHDCDIVFTRPPRWDHYLNDDIWYCSNTVSYVGANYIKSKKFDIYETMCKIIDIDEAIPQENEENSGGAQYIMKNVDYTFWEKMEKDCDTVYQYFMDHLKEHPESPEYHPIQAWCADMYVIIWNCWRLGHASKCPDDMEFSWANGTKEQWDKFTIYHNAGALSSQEHLFFKGNYINKLPYDIVNIYDPNNTTYYYVEEILETAKKSCLI